MNLISKYLVIIISFCLSMTLCYADSVATQSMPIVATAACNVEQVSGLPLKLDAPVMNATVTAPAFVSTETLKPQATAPIAAAQAGLRAKAMDRLRALWSGCKGTSPKALGYAALGCAGSALGYGYRGVKFALGINHKLPIWFWSLMFPKRFVKYSVIALCMHRALLFFNQGVLSCLIAVMDSSYFALTVLEALVESVRNYPHPLTTLVLSVAKYCKENPYRSALISAATAALVLLVCGAIVYGGLFDGLINSYRVTYDFFFGSGEASFFGGSSDSESGVLLANDACKYFEGGKFGALDFFNTELGNIQKKAIGVDHMDDQVILAKAYRALSMVLHPDRGGTDEAFATLGNARACLEAA